MSKTAKQSSLLTVAQHFSTVCANEGESLPPRSMQWHTSNIQ